MKMHFVPDQWCNFSLKVSYSQHLSCTLHSVRNTWGALVVVFGRLGRNCNCVAQTAAASRSVQEVVVRCWGVGNKESKV